jgi:hypothetical protein
MHPRAGPEPRPLGAEPAMREEAAIVRRVAAVRAALLAESDGSPAVRERVERFVARLEELRAELERRRIAASDAGISPALVPGARFAIREGAFVAATGPVAWWGRLNHWVPLRLALWLGRRTSKTPEDPAMHIVVLGVFFVLAAYAAQTALVWHLFGARWALPYLISLPLAATWDHRFQDRMRRAAQRMRTYFQFRADPALQPRLAAEIAWLRGEALALERLAAERLAADRPAREPERQSRRG